MVVLVGLDILGFSTATNRRTIFVNVQDLGRARAGVIPPTRSPGGSTQRLFAMNDATAFGFNLPEVPGLGATAGVEINLQNRNGQDIRDFAQRVQEFQQARRTSSRAAQSVDHELPRERAAALRDVDRESAKARGVNLTDLFGTLQAFLSALYINDFNLFGKTYPRAGRSRAAVPPVSRPTSDACTCAATTTR